MPVTPQAMMLQRAIGSFQDRRAQRRAELEGQEQAELQRSRQVDAEGTQFIRDAANDQAQIGMTAQNNNAMAQRQREMMAAHLAAQKDRQAHEDAQTQAGWGRLDALDERNRGRRQGDADFDLEQKKKLIELQTQKSKDIDTNKAKLRPPPQPRGPRGGGDDPRKAAEAIVRTYQRDLDNIAKQRAVDIASAKRKDAAGREFVDQAAIDAANARAIKAREAVELKRQAALDKLNTIMTGGASPLLGATGAAEASAPAAGQQKRRSPADIPVNPG